MTLNDLLASLEKSAEVKAPEQTEVKPAISQELEAVLSKEASTSLATDAFAEGEKMAQALLTKLAQDALVETPATAATTEVKTEEVEKTAAEAATTQETKGQEMKKEASNQELAKAILEKLAAAENHPGTVVDGAVANKIQEDNVNMVAQHNARIMGNPNGGTLNQMTDELVNRAMGMGTAPYDAVTGGGSQTAAKEGTDPAMGTPAIPATPHPDQEKVAAVVALMDAGADFDSAVDLVKAAAEEIAAEEFQQVKVAAVNQLMNNGYDFDGAVAAVNAAIQAE